MGVILPSRIKLGVKPVVLQPKLLMMLQEEHGKATVSVQHHSIN